MIGVVSIQEILDMDYKHTSYEESRISDDQIINAFTNTSFGTADHRKLLEQGVLKMQAGYRSGHTLFLIMIELGLVTSSHYVTKKGRRFIFRAFEDQAHSG